MWTYFVAMLIWSIIFTIISTAFLVLCHFMKRNTSANALYLSWKMMLFSNLFLTISFVRINLSSKISYYLSSHKSIVSAIYNQVIPNRISSLCIAILLIWVIGVALLLLYHMRKYLYFIRALKRWSVPCRDKTVQDLLANLSKESRVRKPKLHICSCISTPMLFGLFSPVLLIPKGTDTSNYEFTLILKHKITHLKRKDIWIKLLSLLSMVIFWFNPLIHISVKMLEKYSECSCDEIVLKNEDLTNRLRYGDKLVSLILEETHMEPKLSANFYGGKQLMKDRINNIIRANEKKTRDVILVVLAAALIAFGGGFSSVSQNVNRLPQPSGDENEVYLVTFDFDAPDGKPFGLHFPTSQKSGIDKDIKHMIEIFKDKGAYTIPSSYEYKIELIKDEVVAAEFREQG